VLRARDPHRARTLQNFLPPLTFIIANI
jgi:hypothetical protein